MTNEAPQRIWASKGSWPKFYMAPCKDLPLLKEYIRADIAQAEKEAAVAAAYEDAAIRAQSIDHHGWTRTELAAMIRARSNTVEASASHTNALADRDARVRAEALGEAALNLRTYAPHLVDGPEHDVGYYHGYYTAVDRILNLALLGRAAQEENLNA